MKLNLRSLATKSVAVFSLCALSTPAFAQPWGPGGHGPHHPPGGGHRFQCMAQNHRGNQFFGEGWQRWQAENEAMNRCRSVSHRCEIRWCR